MAFLDPTDDFQPLDPAGMHALHLAVNQVSTAWHGVSSPARGYLVGWRVDDEVFGLAVFLHFPQQRATVAYIYDDPILDSIDYPHAEEEGRIFLESMGFLLDEVDLRSLAPNAPIYKDLPFLRGVREASISTTGSVTGSVTGTPSFPISAMAEMRGEGVGGLHLEGLSGEDVAGLGKVVERAAGARETPSRPFEPTNPRGGKSLHEEIDSLLSAVETGGETGEEMTKISADLTLGAAVGAVTEGVDIEITAPGARDGASGPAAGAGAEKPNEIEREQLGRLLAMF